MDTAPVVAPARNTSRSVEKIRGFCQVGALGGDGHCPGHPLLLPISDEIDENGVLIRAGRLARAHTGLVLFDGDRQRLRERRSEETRYTLNSTCHRHGSHSDAAGEPESKKSCQISMGRCASIRSMTRA